MRYSSILLAILVAYANVTLVAASPSRLLQARQAEPSPTGRGACVRSGDTWTCELAQPIGAPASATSIVEEETPSSTTGAASTTLPAGVEASPVGQGECELHDDHWHCSEESEDAHAGHDHAGHSHGPSEEYGCGLAPLEDYNLPLHIGSVFILLAASVAGVVFPFLGIKLPHILFAMRYFGGGIILSTAFIHLLFHAFVYFSNECIGQLKYEATSPAIAMAALYLVFLLEFFILRPFRRRADLLPPTSSDGSLEASTAEARAAAKEGHLTRDSHEEAKDESSSSQLVAGTRDDRLDKYNVLALEAGIIFHSIIIGVTIGTTGGTGWIPLLLALTFHQLCEAIGLASRIALLSSSTSTLSKVLMCAAFSITTPLGIVTGIGVRQSYNNNARGTLLALGILNSLSAGILLYSALVQIIVPDFLANRDLLRAPLSRCLLAFAYFTLGMFAMSVIGYWA